MVNSAYKKLQDNISGDNSYMFNYFCPLKLIHLLNSWLGEWFLTWFQPTKDNSFNRWIRIYNRFCPLCEVEEKCISHLYFTCKVSRVVWNHCSKWININNVQHFKIEQHFQQIYLTKLNNKKNGVWKCTRMTIVWVIWNHRKKVFLEMKWQIKRFLQCHN